jgi:N-acetylmuramoyl-L-alanine amidase
METPSPLPDSQPVTRLEPRRKPRSPRVLQQALVVAILVATLFVSFTPNAISGGLSEQLAVLLTAQPNSVVLPGATPRPLTRIGIVAGHWGNDSGTVCDNGTTEADVNLKIATLVQQKLAALGFETDLLQEFDPRLSSYHAAVLVSIHNDSCNYINDQATGFKVASAMSSRDANLANDMSLYHAFNEIDPSTTAGIIETGFLKLDYDILTSKTDLVATGVANGILCFVNNENIAPTPIP